MDVVVLGEEVVVLLAVVLLREGFFADHFFHDLCALSDEPHHSEDNNGQEDCASHCHTDDKADVDWLAAFGGRSGQVVGSALHLSHCADAGH